MKLLVSHQPILQECMQVGRLTYYLIIIIYMVVLIIILLAITYYELQVHLDGC